MSPVCGIFSEKKPVLYFDLLQKGNRAFADLRYGEEDSISPSTVIFPATKG